ncbi:aldolase/RraA domain-containing protein [Sarocladium implicatum]|nr:aldolase/RraA domain-containing protein [Sarocladium implicatum]
MATMSPSSVVTALKDCDVSDALLKLKKPEGGFLPDLTMWSPERQSGDTKIIGPAYTVKYAPIDDPSPKHPTHYIDTIPEGAVVFVSCPQGVSNACYGGLMSTRAKASGAVGSVIDGRFRDLEEQREQKYPIFARNVGTASPNQVLKVVAVNVPVTVPSGEQTITVHPGDFVIGDLNGVVVLPKELAEEAIPLMRPQVEADAKMAAAIREGMTFAEASKKFR